MDGRPHRKTLARMSKRLDIIDREALSAQLDELAAWSGVTGKTRTKVLEILKEALTRGHAAIRTDFESERQPGHEAVIAIAGLMDGLIGEIGRAHV